MPRSKICPKCCDAVPIRLKVCKSCQHVFRAKRKTEQTLPDNIRKAGKRTVESSEQTLHKQQLEGEHKASMRAVESNEQTLHTQQQNKQHMASARAVESNEQTLHRRQKNKNTWQA